MAAYRRVYDSRHLQADCLELGPSSRTLRSVFENGLTSLLAWRDGASDLRSEGRGFHFRSQHCCVTTLGKLFTPMCCCHQAAWFYVGKTTDLDECRLFFNFMLPSEKKLKNRKISFDSKVSNCNSLSYYFNTCPKIC